MRKLHKAKRSAAKNTPNSKVSVPAKAASRHKAALTARKDAPPSAQTIECMQQKSPLHTSSGRPQGKSAPREMHCDLSQIPLASRVSSKSIPYASITPTGQQIPVTITARGAGPASCAADGGWNDAHGDEPVALSQQPLSLRIPGSGNLKRVAAVRGGSYSARDTGWGGPQQVPISACRDLPGSYPSGGKVHGSARPLVARGTWRPAQRMSGSHVATQLSTPPPEADPEDVPLSTRRLLASAKRPTRISQGAGSVKMVQGLRAPAAVNGQTPPRRFIPAHLLGASSPSEFTFATQKEGGQASGYANSVPGPFWGRHGDTRAHCTTHSVDHQRQQQQRQQEQHDFEPEDLEAEEAAAYAEEAANASDRAAAKVGPRMTSESIRSANICFF